MPPEFNYVVQARDATLDVDSGVFLSNDRIAVSATLRVGFGWPHPAAVNRIEVTQS